LLCLHTVERFATGGFRDAVAGVVGRYREHFRPVALRVSRPDRGAVDLPCRCPVCGQTARLRVKSWLRTNFPVLLTLVVLGLVIAVLGWFYIPTAGVFAIAIAGVGLAVAGIIPLLLLIRPSLLDSLTLALQIVEDVPRAEPYWIIGGADPAQCNYRELLGRGMNQHKLGSIRRVPPVTAPAGAGPTPGAARP
jgi:hypothetical protein